MFVVNCITHAKNFVKEMDRRSCEERDRRMTRNLRRKVRENEKRSGRVVNTFGVLHWEHREEIEGDEGST